VRSRGGPTDGTWRIREGGGAVGPLRCPAGELLDHRLHEVEQRADVAATVEAHQQEELAVACAIYGAARLDTRACTWP
jgi:hypothetical protein